ncbi:glycoside hydrolase family 3 protein, partial [Enterococcus faecalis]
SLWQGLKDAVGAAGGSAELAPDGRFSKRPDAAIVVFGERPYAEFQGDVPDLAYRPTANERDSLRAWHAHGAKVVSLFLSGRPLFTGPEL